MAANPLHRTSHRIVVDAPADIVYSIIADARSWPNVFPPTVHVDVVDKDQTTERLRIWALANGEVKSWTSQRRFDSAARTVVFAQEVSAPPVGSMTGQWTVTESDSGSSTVELTHEFTTVEETPENLAWIDRAIETNSAAELAKLADAAAQFGGRSERILEFEDSVVIEGDQASVYDFIDRADLWVDRLEHVARVRFDVSADGVQELEMDTITPAGESHTTKSYRVAFPSDRIIYKQTTLPVLLAAHTGEWSFTPTSDGTLATSKHVVVLREDSITDVLGAEGTLEAARRLVRSSLSANSLKTLAAAKEFSENAVHVDVR